MIIFSDSVCAKGRFEAEDADYVVRKRGLSIIVFLTVIYFSDRLVWFCGYDKFFGIV